MLQNYFKIAVRNILRSKAYSFINIAGLSLGIACCLLLYMYVADELSYDRHHPRLQDLYRIDTQFSGVAGLDKVGSISPPIAMTVKDELPEVEAAVRVLNPPGVALNLIKVGDQVFYEKNGFIADSTLFDVFGYELLEGNPKKALTDVNTVILSSTLAHKIFGGESALDKSISISQGGPSYNYKITGIFKDDKKSFLNPSFITSMMSEGWGDYIRKNPETVNEWAGQNFIPSYIKLVPGANVRDVERKINETLLRHGAKGLKALGIKKTLFLEPVKDIYLQSMTDKSQRISWLYIIVSIAGFILLIACINFMNLSTAKSTRRSTEIGIRKVMGAYRSSLASQILGEAMIMVIISILISLVLVQLALPVFNELSGKTISLATENIFYFGGVLLALAFITGIIAGSYPAFYISSFQPAQVLKGKFNPGNSTGMLRQTLVVFQFVIAIILVCGMIVITKQLSFMKDKDLGFDATSKVVLPLRTGNARKQYEAIKKELIRTGTVDKVSGGDYMPGSPVFMDMSYYKKGQSMTDATNIKRNHVDEGYLEILGIKLVSGRTFTDNRAMESQGKLIINEAAAARFGLTPKEIEGQQLFFDYQGKHYEHDVIGVMANFNQSSLREPILPYVLEIPENPDNYEYMVMRVPPSRFHETLASIEKIWKANVLDTPFEYSLLDESIQKQYDEEKKISTIITSFTAIAILICSLGLYGLSSFMAERRFREIGVRKVMGASVRQIVSMMSLEFIKLVVISFVIAAPVAWYATTSWLEGFEYKVPVGMSIFLMAGLSALLIAVITVSFESFKAARTNPVTSLRSE